MKGAVGNSFTMMKMADISPVIIVRTEFAKGVSLELSYSALPCNPFTPDSVPSLAPRVLYMPIRMMSTFSLTPPTWQ
jgi:hypothetical protein